MFPSAPAFPFFGNANESESRSGKHHRKVQMKVKVKNTYNTMQECYPLHSIIDDHQIITILVKIIEAFEQRYLGVLSIA